MVKSKVARNNTKNQGRRSLARAAIMKWFVLGWCVNELIYYDEVKQGGVYGCMDDGSPKALNKLT